MTTDRSKFADRVPPRDPAPEIETQPTEEARASREATNREADARPKDWAPPNLLPDPTPQPGWTYRWIRVATGGRSDNNNVSKRFREGWVPVKAVDHPEVMIMSDKNSQFPDGIEIGGLLLCKLPTETVRQRTAHYAKLSQAQTEAVNNAWLQGANPLMKKEILEQATVVKTGAGASK